MNSSLLEFLLWDGKTTQVLRFFRQSVRKDIQSILDGDTKVSLRDVWEAVDSFLKISHRLVHAKWKLQKEQLTSLVLALRILQPQDILFEHKILSEYTEVPLMKNMEFEQMRFATLADFFKLEGICAQERKRSGSSLILSPELREWLGPLVWIKRVDLKRRASHGAKRGVTFVYPKEGVVVCDEFDRSESDCRPGLHVTILINQSYFDDYGPNLLLVTLPMVANGKPNEIVIGARDNMKTELFRSQIKLRARALEVRGESRLLNWSLPDCLVNHRIK